MLEENSPLTADQTLISGNLKFNLKMPKPVYKMGENVDIDLYVKNIGAKPINLKFDKEVEYDFAIHRELNLGFARVPMLVWKRSGLKVSLPKKHSLRLQPDQVKLYHTSWDQTNFKGERVPAGRYLIVGEVNIVGAKASLTLRGRTRK